MMNPAGRCSGPMSRRSFLKVGALALGGMGGAGILPWKIQAGGAGDRTPDTSVIFISVPGGPPPLETYALKTDPPAEYRRAFRPMSTVVPGIDHCDHLLLR